MDAQDRKKNEVDKIQGLTILSIYVFILTYFDKTLNPAYAYWYTQT